MTLTRPIVLLACAVAFSAAGQTLPPLSEPPPPPAGAMPDEDWSTLPPPAQPAAPPVLEAPDEMLTNGATPRSTREVVEEAEARKPPESANTVALFAANALGPGRTAVGVSAGFPFLSLELARGVLPRLDVGVSYDTAYGAFHDVRALARYELASAGGWTLGAVADGGPAFFLESAQKDERGIRWFTGRRNWNGSAGAVVSYQRIGSRLFADVRFQLAFDTEPYQKDPLGGVPAAVQTSWTLPVRMGAEVAQSRWTSLLFDFGFDIHTRPDDAAIMPMVGVGLVTSLF